MVGCDHFHSVITNISPRESRRRGYVAGLIHDNCALEWLRAYQALFQRIRISRIDPAFALRRRDGHRRSNNESLVVGFLCLACVRISGQGTDWMDPAADSWIDNVFRSRNA